MGGYLSMLLLSSLALLSGALLGCGCSHTGLPASPPPSQSPTAELHSYRDQGFSLRFGDEWQDVVQPQSGGVWRLDITPSSTQVYLSQIAVRVRRSERSFTPGQFQDELPKSYAQSLAAIAQSLQSASESFEATELNGMPALVAAYSDGETNHRWYLIGNGHSIYSITLSGHKGTWRDEQRAMMDVVNTFTLI